jgi:hypothetical protein
MGLISRTARDAGHRAPSAPLAQSTFRVSVAEEVVERPLPGSLSLHEEAPPHAFSLYAAPPPPESAALRLIEGVLEEERQVNQRRRLFRLTLHSKNQNFINS